MLIITADDYGKDRKTTDAIWQCFEKNRITSASAMVFMEDSIRAADLAKDSALEIGLHLNFTMNFNGPNLAAELIKQQKRIVSYLSYHKAAQILFNPFLSNSFQELFEEQLNEFMRLYGRPPDFYNGHHHMHLCANLVAAGIIPRNSRVRGTFTFERSERHLLNLLYRRILQWYVARRFITPDYFYSIEPVQDTDRLWKIVERARAQALEIEVHPEKDTELVFLLSDEGRRIFGVCPLGSFQGLSIS